MGKQKKRLSIRERRALMGTTEEGGPARKVAQEKWDIRRKNQRKMPITLYKGNKANAEDMYGPIIKKIQEVYGGDIDIANDTRIDENVRRGLTAAFETSSLGRRNIPPMGKSGHLQELQDIIVNTPNKDVKNLLSKDYSKIGITNFTEYLPDSVSVWDALGYANTYRKLTKEGYTFAKGTGPNGVKNNDMKRKTNVRKKRSVDNYAMGSGNTGVIKGYMPDPSEVFRQDQINADKAISEAASNPFVMGLDMLGGLTTQVGMSMMGGAGGADVDGGGATPGEDVAAVNPSFKKVAADKGVDFKTGNPLAKEPGEFLTKDTSGAPWANNALGTGTQGVGGVGVNVEKGEIIETPDGQMTEEGGDKHSAPSGGNNKVVPKGSLVFSDQLMRDGQTMAYWKKSREASLKKMTKALEKDPTDMIAKETYKKSKEKYDLEEQNDLLMQGIAGEMDKMYEAAMGTDMEGVQSYADGTGWEGVGDFFSGFTGGDYLSMAGNLYSGVAPLLSAKKNAADNTVNENQFADFGQDAIATAEDSLGMLEGNRAQAEKKIQLSANKANTDLANTSRGVNMKRAGKLGVFSKQNEALSDLYTNFSKTMMDGMMKKSMLQNQRDQAVMTGAGVADVANRMDADNADTQIGVAQETLGRGIQTMGKDLNTNRRSNVLANLAGQLSKYGLSADKDGVITKKKE